jgi:hypothetical protein
MQPEGAAVGFGQDLKLISLISRAGDVTIDELEARTGLGQLDIINSVSEMVRRGLVELSASKEWNDGTAVPSTLSEQISNMTEQMKRVEVDSPELVAEFDQFVSDNRAAGAIHVMPTVKGWRSGL